VREIKTVCPRDCYDTCSLIVLVNDENKIVSIRGDKENPITQGFICARAAKDPERIYINRILYPYIRKGKKPKRSFEKVSWEKALDLVVSKLKEVLANYGSEYVLHLEYTGNQGLLTRYFSQRIWYAIGATRTDDSLCSRSGHEALFLHYGSSYGIQPEELPEMKLIVFWGFNALVSAPHLWSLSLKARRKEAVIVTIDPRRSETAKLSDIWLKIKPSSDVALAYGIARYLIEHNYVDLEFIEKWTYGYEEFKREVMKWTPSKVERVTGVKWSLIEKVGELYGKMRPSATMIGIGLQKNLYGAESVRAVSLIPALLGFHRGFYYSNSKGWLVDIAYLTGEKLTNKNCKVVSQVALSEHVERGEFKFIFIYNMNPALTIPNQRAFRKGLLRDDVFVVVYDTHWTETANYADVVLPAPTYLEKNDLVISYSHRYVRISKKIIEPLGESRNEIWLMRELAERLGLKEAWIFEEPWEALRKSLKNAFESGSFEDLIEGKTLKLKYRPRNEYQTLTGKIEFYSIKAEKLRLNPLPKQYPLELKDGEFILLNSSTSKYTHTQFREVYGPIPPIVVINSEDARLINVKEGDVVDLFNEYGRVRVKIVVDDFIQRGVLWSPRQLIGLNGEPQNSLIPSVTQKLGGGPIFNSSIVKIAKVLNFQN